MANILVVTAITAITPTPRTWADTTISCSIPSIKLGYTPMPQNQAVALKSHFWHVIWTCYWIKVFSLLLVSVGTFQPLCSASYSLISLSRPSDPSSLSVGRKEEDTLPHPQSPCRLSTGTVFISWLTCIISHMPLEITSVSASGLYPP